ncbi:hypothetical protein MTO96_012267 [Rhipicephalus appendiculatus]
MEDMLRHFENECTLHSVECFRCGEAVLHRELGMHYVAGCMAARVSSARTDDTSSDSRALTLQDVRNALEEVKLLLRDPNRDHVLPAIQSQVNQLTEEVRNQESRLTEITGEVGLSASAATAQHAATASSTGLQVSASPQNPADKASTSTSSLSCLQEMLVNQRPDILSNLLPHVLEQMQQTSTQDYPQHVVDYLGPPNGACHLTLTTPLSTTRTWREVLGTATYVITLENCVFSSSKSMNILGNIAVLHTRDAYFFVCIIDYKASLIFGHTLDIGIKFVGEAYGSRSLAPSFDVTAYDSRT